MLSHSDKQEAESRLRTLCIGLQVVGVRWFAFNFSIAIEPFTPQTPPTHKSNLSLTIESRWTIFSTMPDQLPERDEDIPELPLEKKVALLAQLAGHDIVAVSLGNEQPHLMLTFNCGRILFINGYHHEYESWQLSTVGEPEERRWDIIAIPGGNIAIFNPQNVIHIE